MGKGGGPAKNPWFPRKPAAARVCGSFVPCVERVAFVGEALKKRRSGTANQTGWAASAGPRPFLKTCGGGARRPARRRFGAPPVLATFGARSTLNACLRPASFSPRGTRPHLSLFRIFGMFLIPVLAAEPRPKILQLGLGCGDPDGPGEAVELWHDLFPKILEVWVAEGDAACAAAYARADAAQWGTGPVNHTNVLTGDPADREQISEWARLSGSYFDAVAVDATGRNNTATLDAFDELWPHVQPGGVYFVWGLGVSRSAVRDDTGGDRVAADAVAAWVDQLAVPGELDAAFWGRQPTFRTDLRARFPLPDDAAFVHCAIDACAIGKTRTILGSIRGLPPFVDEHTRTTFRSDYR